MLKKHQSLIARDYSAYLWFGRYSCFCLFKHNYRLVLFLSWSVSVKVWPRWCLHSVKWFMYIRKTPVWANQDWTSKMKPWKHRIPDLLSAVRGGYFSFPRWKKELQRMMNSLLKESAIHFILKFTETNK